MKALKNRSWTWNAQIVTFIQKKNFHDDENKRKILFVYSFLGLR